jgi:hypothetical protein
MYSKKFRQFNMGQHGPEWVLHFNSPNEKKHAHLEGTDIIGMIEWTESMVNQYNADHKGSPYIWRDDNVSI